MRAVVDEVGAAGRSGAVEESFTRRHGFDRTLAAQIAALLDDAPVIATGAGHDAGMLAAAGVAGGDAVRPQPDWRLALACRACRAGRLPDRRRRSGHRARGARAMRYFADYALLPSGFAVTSCSRCRRPVHRSDCRHLPGDAHRLPGVVLPGFANAHSHAFHRALRARIHGGGGSFWSWREAMYSVASRLDPDSYLALARATYAEMALAGVTSVGEFHYLHHAPDGVRYADPNVMAEAFGRQRRMPGSG